MYQPSPDVTQSPHFKIYPVPPRQGGGSSGAAAATPDFEKLITPKQEPETPAVTPKAAAAPEEKPEEKKDSSFLSFIKGIIDVVNPLQHIPVISTIYRHLTGDEISDAARFAGDALYGGAIGGAVAAADIAFKHVTGKPVDETVLASLTGGGKNETTQIASVAGPASHSLTSPPVPQKRDVASTNILQAQEAPERAARKAAPPELIASRMMEGLQKYAAMKQGGLSPTSSGLY